jgi:hypothetical protein
MTTNMGALDRSARLVLAAVLLFFAFGTSAGAAGLLHWLAIAVAAIFALTAVLGTCPLYSLVGLKTCKEC